MSFQSASPQKRLSSSNWFGPSSTKIIGGNRVVFGEPPFAAALRHFPVSDTLCKKAAGPSLKIFAEATIVSVNPTGLAAKPTVRSVTKMSGQKRRLMFSTKLQDVAQLPGTVKKPKSPLLTAPAAETPTTVTPLPGPKDEEKKAPVPYENVQTPVLKDKEEMSPSAVSLPLPQQLGIVAPTPRLPPFVGHRGIDAELNCAYDVPAISPPLLTDKPCGWVKEFSQQVRKAMDEIRGSALESILKRWTYGMIKGQQLPSFEVSEEYLSSIVESVTLGPEGDFFHQSRISKVFEDQIDWLESFRVFKQTVDPQDPSWSTTRARSARL